MMHENDSESAQPPPHPANNPPQSHYCKSIVGVLQGSCFLLSATVKWLHYSVVAPTTSVELSGAHICPKPSMCRLQAEVIVLQVTKVDAIVTNKPNPGL